MVAIQNVLKVEDSTGLVYYLGTISPKLIKELTFVPVQEPSENAGSALALNERTEHGYQRGGDLKRMEAIKSYILENADRAIPPILLSARGKWEFHPGQNSLFGSLQANDLAAIMDGQHRLGGLWLLVNDTEASEALKNRPIPFMLIENLDVDRERDTFIDVNDNQKGVKPSLLKYLRREKSFVGQAALALMEDPDSVLHARITIQKKEDWSLLLFGAIQECVLLTYDSAFVQTTRFKPDESSEHRAKAIGFLIQYWREVADSLPEMWSDIAKLPPVGSPKSKLHPGTKAFEYRLLEETGIRAMSRLASLIFRKSWIPESESPAWEKVRELVSRLKVDQDAKLALTKPHLNPDVEKLNPLLKSTGKAGVTTIYNYLEQSIIV